MTDQHEITVERATSQMGVPIDLNRYSKAQSDGVRMVLLLAYGHRQLELSPEGSRVTVRILPGQRSIDVQSLVDRTALRFASDTT